MIEKVKELMVGKTIEGIEFSSYQATNDSLLIKFTDSTHIKIRSDPNMCFEGLAFYILKTTTKIVETKIEEEEEIK